MRIFLWEDIETPFFCRKQTIIKDEFETNGNFRDEILSIVKNYVKTSCTDENDYI